MAIVIDLQIEDKGVSQVFDNLDKTLASIGAAMRSFGRDLSRAATQANRLANAMGRVHRNSRGIPALPGAPALPGRSRSTRAPGRFNSNSINDPQAILNTYGTAALGGDAAAQRWVLAAQTAQNRQRRVQRALQPPNPIQDALMRTRFVQQGGKLVGMPLGRDLGALQGLMGSLTMGGGNTTMMGGAAAAGAGVAGGLATAGIAVAVVGFTAALTKGAQSIKKLADDFVSLGGSIGESIAAARLQRFSGVSAGSVGGAVRGGGIATAMGARFGLSPVPEWAGGPSDSEVMVRVMRGIANAGSYTEARRTAAAFGSPELAKIRLLDPDMQRKLLRVVEGKGDFKNIVAAANFDANVAIVQDAIDRLARRLTGPLFDAAGGVAGQATDIMDKLPQGLTDAMLKGPLWTMLQIELNRLNNVFDFIAGIFGGGKGKDSAQERNTKAVEKLTDVMQDGVYGGKGRARRSTPGDRLAPDERDRMRQRANYGLL